MSNSKKLNPDFNFEKSKIGINDIKDDARKHMNEFSQNSPQQFPVHVFPEPVKRIIEETNKCLNYPVDFIGASLLFAASLAIGSRFKVSFKQGWIEGGVFYMAMVGFPGTNKSHPITFALQPFLDLDDKSFDEYKKEFSEYQRICNLSKQEKKNEGIGEIIKPHWTKNLVSDFTIEALAAVHQNNLRGVAVYADELAGWFKNFNRYNKGSEMEFWLSGWSGKPINVDRKTSEPIHISHPFIGVIGTIQNGILTELAKENRSQNGFIDRILFVMPTDLKKQSWSDSEISQQVIDDWNKILLSIFNTPSGFTQEGKKENYRVLKFNEHARKTLKEWQEYNTELCNAAETESISGIYSKIETYVLRFALVFEFILYGCKQSGGHEISAEALNAAIALAEYFRHTALKVNSIINNYDPLERLPGDKREFYDSLPDSFTTEIALTIAEKLKIPPRSAKRFLGNKELFKRLKRGLYEKME